MIVPDDFPGITVETFGPVAPGSLFLSVSADVEGTGYYVMVLDNEGKPVRYRELAGDYAYDFKMQPNGLLSYAQFISHHSYTGGGNVVHMLLDQQMNVVDSLQMKNGYVAEAHDFQLLPNGHALMIGYYMTRTDLSDRVEGGYPDARVSGGIIQELDDRGKVIFQWRSWDHFDIDSYSFRRGANRQEVSAFHLNTINMDVDGNLLVATPRVVRKISRQTGEVLWTMGGEENQFSFTGVDSLTGLDQSNGHAFYRLENGNYLVYNNGGRMHTQDNSSVHEFRLDQENLTAGLVWSYHPDRPIPAWHRGNAFRLPNGNTLIGWGGASGKPVPVCTEVDSTGRVVLEAFFTDSFMESYRAFRFELGEPLLFEDSVSGMETGKEYDFHVPDTVDWRVRVRPDSLWGANPEENRLRVRVIGRAPLNPLFPGRDPRVLPAVVQLIASGAGFSGVLKIDPSGGKGQPEGDVKLTDLTIYQRNAGPGQEFFSGGTFFDPQQELLSTAVSMEAGDTLELVTGYPDLPYLARTPSCAEPENHGVVNLEEPVRLEWAPEGFFTRFTLQVATDSLFQSVIYQKDSLESTVHLFEPETAGDHFWRVKTFTEEEDAVLESEWSAPSVFLAAEPFLELVAPRAGDRWQQGEDQFIEWTGNLSGQVRIGLYREGLPVQELAVTGSDGAWKWEIPQELEIGCRYQIRISSSADDLLSDEVKGFFSVVDSTGSDGCEVSAPAGTLPPESRVEVLAGPGGDGFRIRFGTSGPARIRTEVFNLLGQKVFSSGPSDYQAGDHTIFARVPSGTPRLWIISLEVNGVRWFRKMVY